ncbi:hypothetical protein ABT269_39785 [Streptomyces viridosporus]
MVKDDLRSWQLGRVVTVADSGFSSEADLAYLTRADGHCITGVKIRETNKKAATARAGRAATRTCATTSGSTDHPTNPPTTCACLLMKSGFTGRNYAPVRVGSDGGIHALPAWAGQAAVSLRARRA